MSKGYDSKCFDLATHFLDDDECGRCGISHPHRDACNDELAQLIQNTIEGFLSTHECRKPYLPDVRTDVPRPVCRCSSDEFDRTPCPVHGKAA